MNIKLTNLGRKQLSRGSFNFSTYVVGDSEVDYSLIKNGTITSDRVMVLRAKDKNPQIITYLRKGSINTKYNELPPISTNPLLITNSVNEYGFFSENDLVAEPTHVKQADINVRRVDFDGSNVITLYKSPEYLANRYEPVAGDLMMIKFDNNSLTLDNNNIKPVLFYKIYEVISGSLEGDNLKVMVDRNLPDFNNDSSGQFGSNYRAIIYPNKIEDENVLSTDYLSEEVMSFITNIQPPETAIPMWNMSITYGSEIIGTKDTNYKLKHLKSTDYSSFISYIQEFNVEYDNLGIIHYTNSLPSNVYGEGFFNNTSVIKIPSIVWHKSSIKKYGLTLSTMGGKKTMSKLGLEYYDLIDEDGNVVGKVFNGLKLFVVEDQELLFAMSYKSNRSWTIPKPVVGINVTNIDENENVQCTMVAEITSEFLYGNQSIVVRNVKFTSGSEIYVEIRDQNGDIKLMSNVDDLNEYYVVMDSDTYDVKLIDSGIGNCNLTVEGLVV